MVYITADAANKSGALRDCIYCSAAKEAAKEDGKPSSYARAAEPLLRILLPPSYPLAMECKWLRGKYGAMDFSLPVVTTWGLRWLDVEVDGETHFNKPRQGQQYGDQKAVDR